MKTLLQRTLSVWVMATILFSVPTPAHADSVSMLLEKGMYTEDTVGDVDGAIKIYQQILTEAETNRRYVAQARLRLGMCYLKKKQAAQAQAEFEKIVTDFADQKDAVAQARKLLPPVDFPEIEKCRIVRRIEIELSASGTARSAAPLVPVYADDALQIAWNAPAEVVSKSRQWMVGLRVGTQDKWVVIKTIKDVSKRSATLNSQGRPVEPGDYVLTVIASDSTEGFGEKNRVAVFESPITVKPAVYTQISIDEILPDGVLQGRSIMHECNDEDKPLEKIGFVSSDFVHTTRMTDENGEPMEFTAKHEGSIYRYQARLNKPVPSGGWAFYASESTIQGLVRPVRGKAGLFEYRMQHSPGAEVPTRRIEIFRLPAGAQVVSTTPTEMLRRVKDGRTELLVEKIIPPGGSILTIIRYELATTSGPASQPAALQIRPAPWTDGEELQLRIMSMAGAEFGTIYYRASAGQANGKPAWHIESDMFISLTSMLQYTSVIADRDTFAPIRGITRNSEMGDFTGKYASGSVELTSRSAGKENTRNITLEGPVYDNEQVLYLMRRLPLAKDYHASFDIFPVQGGSIMECRIHVTKAEKVTVPAGDFDCYAISLSVYAEGVRVLEHQVWMSADAHQYLVKYDSGAAVMELTNIRQAGKLVAYEDPGLKISLPLPAGWHAYRSPAKTDIQVTVQLLVPEQKGWALLATQPNTGDAGSSRSVAEGDIESLKGFFKNYTVRPASWTDVKIAGISAARYEADYQDKGRDMVEYRTYIVAERMVYWFVFRVEKGAFADMKPVFDKIMDGFKVTK